MEKGSKGSGKYLNPAITGAGINAEDAAVQQPDFYQLRGCELPRMLYGRAVVGTVNVLCRAYDNDRHP